MPDLSYLLAVQEVDRTIKTASFTAEVNRKYLVDTSGGEFTLSLPFSPSPGDFVEIKDVSASWEVNPLVIGRNGSKIFGNVVDFTLDSVAGEDVGGTVEFVYVNSAKGWVL